MQRVCEVYLRVIAPELQYIAPFQNCGSGGEHLATERVSALPTGR